ncbi:hypothetical protein NEOLI_002473 [Neolecta irregularis DAH-3]|uniref:Uncharacterized protein n=1 Tax=Neolecta irregularis (strain DAH-3) TaxID=1198029 RepID=A0A1U7LJ66_NEOID|nr:hypothetical protein NEOLI_002473 [Neolecta irregularis DAH-3]|eukprot:OLL22668.1 hypothetical protein NEOLI_002473 [Neolecta irregularis DAH-3]
MAKVQHIPSPPLSSATFLSEKSNSRRCSSRFCAQKAIPLILRTFFEASVIPDNESILENSIDEISQIWEFPPDTESLDNECGLRSSALKSRSAETRNDTAPNRAQSKCFLTQGIYATASQKEVSFLWPLPMYVGQDLLREGRNFFLPWDILALTDTPVKISGWRNIKRSIGVIWPDYADSLRHLS